MPSSDLTIPYARKELAMPHILDIPETPSVLEMFEVTGLNGFKNLSLYSPNCVRIVVAENGTGKTTLLNMLYAVLSKKILKLHQFNFNALTIKFQGTEKYTVSRDELFPFEISLNNTWTELLQYVEATELFDFYSEMSPKFSTRNVRSHPTFRKIYNECPYDTEQTIAMIRRARPEIERTQIYANFTKYISNAMKGLQVLYLPTFRRIETEFAEFTKRQSRDLFGRAEEEETLPDDKLIWFGMGDVEAQLNLIKGRIKSETFSAYSRLSVQSLEDLLSPNSKSPDPIPSDNTILGSQLKLVLARLGQAQESSGGKIWEIIANEEINKPYYDNLRSYLFQMLEIYTTTQNDEDSIERFVSVINNYWETSAFESASAVEKKFVFDKMSLDIDIRTPYSPEPLALGNLSSGEKQIVSVFAKLHLQNNKNFIILIDEPELSLSMAWQKLFLPDILESPSCKQLIAITHSPFIFENALDDFAAPLFISYDRG